MVSATIVHPAPDSTSVEIDGQPVTVFDDFSVHWTVIPHMSFEVRMRMLDGPPIKVGDRPTLTIKYGEIVTTVETEVAVMLPEKGNPPTLMFVATAPPVTTQRYVPLAGTPVIRGDAIDG